MTTGFCFIVSIHESPRNPRISPDRVGRIVPQHPPTGPFELPAPKIRPRLVTSTEDGSIPSWGTRSARRMRFQGPWRAPGPSPGRPLPGPGTAAGTPEPEGSPWHRGESARSKGVDRGQGHVYLDGQTRVVTCQDLYATDTPGSSARISATPVPAPQRDSWARDIPAPRRAPRTSWHPPSRDPARTRTTHQMLNAAGTVSIGWPGPRRTLPPCRRVVPCAQLPRPLRGAAARTTTFLPCPFHAVADRGPRRGPGPSDRGCRPSLGACGPSCTPARGRALPAPPA